MRNAKPLGIVSQCNKLTWKAMEPFCGFQASQITACTIKAAGVAVWSQQAEQEFYGVERKSREAPDQRAVEADILQVLADVDFDQRNQLRHIPGFHLIGDEGRDAALLLGDEAAQHGDEALVDLGAKLGVAGERFACRDEHAAE